MKALFITPEKTSTNKGLYEFLKKVDFEKSCKGTVKLFAACRYILYINGKYICEGPCRSSEDIRYYETVEVDFEKGKNTIIVQVMHMTVERELSSCFKSDKPMLIFQACTEFGVINSDTDWKCEHIVSNVLVSAMSLNANMIFVPPFENVTGRKNTQELTLEEYGCFDFDEIERNPFGIETSLNI